MECWLCLAKWFWAWNYTSRDRRLWGKLGTRQELEWQTHSQNRLSQPVLSFYAQQFFCLSKLRSCRSLKGLCSFVICERFRVSLYKWTALELESFLRWRIYELAENKKNWATSLKESETRESKRFPFSSHFTWPRRFRSIEKRMVSGSRRINN